MTTHWHDTTSVPGPVDPDGCCKDQPTAADIAAGLRAQQEAEAAERLADGLRGGRGCHGKCGLRDADACAHGCRLEVEL